ncbi:MAG: thioredoxin fold domain-containing protein [Arcobacter sp.]|uniref:thioredoxin family protein n=1 Tax=Arcobacter sp. TaxID=1872629 RepID=UPI003B00DDBF
MLFRFMILFVFIFTLNLFAGYKEGKKIFDDKCSSCHGTYISISSLKTNFFEKDNKLYNLDTPTENMLAYAIIDSSKKIGDPEDPEMRVIEIEEFLKSYLANPDLNNSVCDPMITKYYKKKEPMQITEEEANHLAQYFMEYKKQRELEHPKTLKVLEDGYDENNILKEAKKQDKTIIVYATSKTCYFCKKMKKEVLDLEDIQSMIDKNFIFLEVDVDNIELPFNLKKNFYGMTPTFFFVSNENRLLNTYPGAWIKDDFIQILKENINK